MSSAFGTIVQIGDILVSEEVVLEYFACDYAKCRGVCCIEGDCGAPLEESELPALEREYPAYSPLMRPEGREAVDAKGFFELDIEGDIVTPVTARDKDFAGGCAFRKPQSCRLYPIRITKLTGGGLAFNLHRWGICKDAFEKGRREGVRVYQFLKEPLTDLFGESFYQDLCAAAEYVIAQQEK